jgi:hypothetical protein
VLVDILMVDLASERIGYLSQFELEAVIKILFSLSLLVEDIDFVFLFLGVISISSGLRTDLFLSLTILTIQISICLSKRFKFFLLLF